MSRALALLMVVTAACSGKPPKSPRPPHGGGGTGTGSGQTPTPGGAHITWKRVETATDMPAAPKQGEFQVHLIDVGTGLAILVRGSDFAMLYDAGSNDKEEKPTRVVAYLAAALGPSGDDQCVDKGASPPDVRVPINHVVLSHPHFDHASMLEHVLHCYDVKQFWDSGRVNDAVFYREMLAGLAKSSTTHYHTAADVPDTHAVDVKGFTVTVPHWEHFSEGDTVQLGESARFTILHAEGKAVQDPNVNSVVLAVELGKARLLLVGDSPSGPRKDPSFPVGEVEEYLIDHHANEIRADILQVGHHGSKTSSRHGFLEAVKPMLALVSSGPKQYGRVTLPDHEVLEELEHVGAKILRTDERDSDCPVQHRIGGDYGPGGCDSWVITIAP